jgi:Putative prokaryotic signal transducing protein
LSLILSKPAITIISSGLDNRRHRQERVYGENERINMADLISVQTFTQRYEAEVAQGLLSEEGIDSIISADDCGGQRPDLSVRMGGVQLVVRKEDAEKAKEILKILAEEYILDE